MRRLGIGAVCGVVYTGALSLLAAAGLSPGMLLPALAYAGLGWWAAAGSPDLKTALHRAGTAALGCAVATWLISAVVAAPKLAGLTFGQVGVFLLSALLGEVKFVALAALVGRRQVRSRGALPAGPPSLGP
ncbi:MAG: hypothetical protein K0R39_2560 [Symbiobacteriaceae bacterium]|jgi:hypothetical protein|nr:hypothetical protein [Symbiobacteriaceae bacterium]